MFSKSFVFIAMAAIATAVAEPVIKITSDKPIQQENMVKNGGFEENMKYWGKLPQKSDGSQISLDKIEGATGEHCLQIKGVPSLQCGAYQRINFNPPVATGEPMLLTMRIKKDGCDFENKKFGGIALHASWDKASLKQGEAGSKYLPVFEFIHEDHDWVYRYYEIPVQSKPIISMTLYLCYYNNEGVCTFDDISLYRGTSNATIEVAGDEAREISVYHSIRGRLLNEKLTGSAVKKLEVPAYGALAVAVTGADGKVTWKQYPENVDVNAAAENVIPLGAIKRYFLQEQAKSQKFTFDKPAVPAGKKAYLEFQARANGPRLAGHAHIRSVSVNGKTMTGKQIVKPGKEFTSSTGKIYGFYGSNSYLVFYSPACFAIDTENTYCPASLPSRNPFEFKVDISDFLQEGSNTITFSNTARFNPKYKPVDIVENPRITIE